MHDLPGKKTTRGRSRPSRGLEEKTEVVAGSPTSQITPSNLQDATTPPGWRALFAFTTTQHSALLFGALAISIASGAGNPFLSIFLGRIFDAFTDFGSGKLDAAELRSRVTKDSVYLAGLGSASWLFNGAFFMLWLTFGEMQAKACRITIFDGLLDKPAAWYDTRKLGIGGLMPRIQTQTRELQIATSQPLGYFIQYSASAVTAICIAMYYSWNLTLVILASLPVSALILSLISMRMQSSIDSQKEELSVASKSAVAAFTAIETIKYFNGQDFEARKYADAVRTAAKYYVLQARANAMQIGFSKFATFCMFVLGFWYGSHLVISEGKTTGTIITTFWATLEATQTIEQVLPHMLVLEKGRAAGAALKSLVALIRSDPAVLEANAGQRPARCLGRFDLCNVTFAYPAAPAIPALRNITMSLPVGQTMFIIGKSGSGKSTLAQLFLRFYEPNAGDIFLDGIPLSKLDCHWLRKNITLVEQQSTLFRGTFFDNIRLGNVDTSDISLEDVRQAAEFALLRQTINDLPDGGNTFLGGRGTNLSGGQRQRMAIARARLRNSPVVIFDESTSALDHTSKSLIMAAIRQWRKGKTTIYVSHDITQIENDDLVYLFEGGRLMEQGYRHELESRSSPLFFKYIPQKTQGSSLTNGHAAGHRNTQYMNPDAISSKETSAPLTTKRFHDATDLFGAYLPSYTPYGVKTGDRMASTREPIPSADDVDLLRSFDSPLTQKRTSRMSFVPRAFTSPIHDVTDGTGPLLGLTSFIPPTSPRRSVMMSSKCNGTVLTRHLKREGTVRVSTRLSTGAFELMQSTGLIAVENRVTMTKRARRIPTAEIVVDELVAAEHAVGKSQSVTIVKILGTIWPALNRRFRLILVAGFISAALHAASLPMFSWIFSKLLSTFYQQEHASSSALKWSLSVLALAVVDAVSSFEMHILLEASAQAWVDDIRVSAMKRILDQPRQFFSEDENSPSQLAQNLDRNAEEMRNLLGRYMSFVVVAILVMAMAVVWSLTASWKLTLVGLSIMPITFAISICFQKVSAHFEAQTNDAAEAIGTILSETCTNMKTVRALTLENHFRTKYTEAVKYATRIGLRKAVYSGVLYGLSESMTDYSNAVIFYYGALLASTGQSSVQHILTVFSMVIFSMANVTTIISFIPQINSSKDTAARLLHLAHNLPATSHEHEGTVRPTRIGDITLRNLNFSYPSRPTELILQNVNLTFPTGSTTAVVGFSGSGKSTVASLLLRLYPVSPPPTTTNQPQLTVSTRSILRHHTRTLRSLISIVPQTCILFPGTIAQNISYGLASSDPYGTIANVQAAAEAAGIHEFVTSLPEGYETLVGEGGAALSGGQTQRLAIARALVRRPQVLVLDEATSALDAEAAGLVRETVRRLVRGVGRGMTVIIITHEREMMEVAERVIVLERGRVVEEGSFDGLLAKGGKFAKLLNGGVWTGAGGVE